MKNFTLLSGLFLLFSLTGPLTSAQYTWSWAITEGGPVNEYITAITCDADGNIYASGAFEGTLDFFGETIVSAGDNDVFVASFTPDGNLAWVRTGGGGFEDIPFDICTDNLFVYVTGGFYEEAVFDNETLVSRGVRDMFLLKYDPAGNLQWAAGGGGVTDDYGQAVAAGDDGNIYLAGVMNHAATFGNYTVNNFGFTDIFIVKYDADGTCQWAKGAGGQSYDYASSIAIKDNHLFTGGSFNDVAAFDTASVTSVEFNDIFIAHYLTDGSFVEVVSAGGMNNDVLECMALDDDMNVYAGGSFMLDMTIGNNTFTSNGSLDMFLAKYEPGNGFVWAKQFGAEGIDEITDIYCDGNGHFIFAGNFENTIHFGTIELASEGYDDACLVECTINGDVECACQIGGSGSVSVRGCVGDDDGNYYAGGDFVEGLRIGDFTFNATGAYDLFLAQLAEGTGVADEMDMVPGFSIFPNPCSGAVHLRYLIRDSGYLISDLLGISGNKIRELVRQEISPGEYEMEIDVSDLPAGIYFLRLRVGKETVVKKLVKMEL
jgi:hypothetical protein